ncbi:hypothetical protein Dsin_025800 [Dipteronia sinensis]|uniref:Transposase MuDR plant domain-containing protein n=1 Tax=Dipteronia sinensis TaxID=43782 RepID=A0AAE0DX59_9ROSI|nr:hypothetical protein Dsin_025800 [Dipteronia sinensis]
MFDGQMENYIGERINFFDYLNLNELSMLDLDDIALELGYKLHMGFWIQVPGSIANSQRNELLHYQQPEAYDDWAEADMGGKGPDVGEEKEGETVAEEAKNDGAEEAENDDGDQLVESDYEQEQEDISADTYIPRPESGVRSDIDEGSEDLNSLEGSDTEEVERGHVRKFRNQMYYEFNPSRDMQDLKFMLGMKFGSADVFKNAIRAHVVKNKRVVKFKKNDPNWVRAVCGKEGCNWKGVGSEAQKGSELGQGTEATRAAKSTQPSQGPEATQPSQ